MAEAPFDQLCRKLGNFRLTDGLLFLNRVLQAATDPDLEPTIFRECQVQPGLVTDFKIDFLAKWLILKGSDLSPYTLDWPAFVELSNFYNRIDDPIVGDPSFADRNPVEVFVRMLGQQILGRASIPIQTIGSALMLYQETAAALATQTGYALPARFAELVGLTIPDFMQLGFVFLSGRAGPYRTRGTVSSEYLAKAVALGISAVSESNVARFIDEVGATYEQFRVLSNNPVFVTTDPRYKLYEFNVLKKRPLIVVGEGKYVAPNPSLLLQRVTSGIYYTLLDADGEEFSRPFGKIFEHHIGKMLRTVFPPEKLIPELDYGPKKARKRGPADWSVLEDNGLILFECKSMTPTLSLLTYAQPNDLAAISKRLADTLAQVNRHIEAIERGEVGLEKFRGRELRIVVVTLDAIPAVNSSWFKELIDRALKVRGIQSLRYTVLSLMELEHHLSLVERGVVLSELLARLETGNVGQALEPYRELLAERAVLQPTFAKARGLLDSIISSRDIEPSEREMAVTGVIRVD